MHHEIMVMDRTIKITRGPRFVANNVSVDTFGMVLDAEWDEADWISVIFTHESLGSKRLAYQEDGITVPPEVLTKTGSIRITVIGYVGEEERLVTKYMSKGFVVDKSGVIDADDISASTPDEYRQVIEAVDEVKNYVEEKIGYDFSKDKSNFNQAVEEMDAKYARLNQRLTEFEQSDKDNFYEMNVDDIRALFEA